MRINRKFSAKVEAFIILLAHVKIIGSIIKLILKPLAKRGFIPFKIALYLPVIGKIPVSLATGEHFLIENKGRDGVANSLYWLGIEGLAYDTRKVWIELARKSNVIFDVGAYTGLMSLLAAAVNSKAQIFAFEPLEAQFQYLKRNISINNFDNIIIPVQKAVSDKESLVKINIAFCPFLPSSASIISDHHNVTDIKEQVMVNTITIDSFVKERNIDKVDLVILNVETAEPNVLNGMTETTQEHHPIFIIEVHPDIRVEGFLQDYFLLHGYVWYWLTDKGLEEKKTVKGDPNHRFLDYLFIHGSRADEVKNIGCLDLV